MVELCILDQLLREIGHGIPVQELFDLAIGTSTGKLSSVSELKAV